MHAESEDGVLPTSEESGDTWDADDTPRLDDYFRGQVRKTWWSYLFGDNSKRTTPSATSVLFLLKDDDLR